MKLKISYEMSSKLKDDENIESAKKGFAIAFFEQIKDRINFNYDIEDQEVVVDEKKVKKKVITVTADMIDFRDVIKPERETRPAKVKTVFPDSKSKEKINNDVVNTKKEGV